MDIDEYPGAYLLDLQYQREHAAEEAYEERTRIVAILDAAAEQEKQAVTYYSAAATFNADLCERALVLYNQARRLADAVRVDSPASRLVDGGATYCQPVREEQP